MNVTQKKILIIDDEPLVTHSLERLLVFSGYSAVVAGSAKEALEKVKDNNFDLIISDVRMPDSNGIEAIKNIRGCLSRANRPRIPEILITGYVDENIYKEAELLEVADYLYKPFDIKEFLDVVSRNLKQKAN